MRLALEQELCEEYLKASSGEIRLKEIIGSFGTGTTLVIMQGFEDRTSGVLEAFANARLKTERLIIARYLKADGKYDQAHTSHFEALARRVAPRSWTVVPNSNDGEWVKEAMAADGDRVVFDITGASNRAMFRILDNLEASTKPIFIAYTEAKQYWPRKQEWDRLRRQLTAHHSIAELVDTKPWMFSYEHTVELVPGHEGYDASGTGRALVAFLPYKSSRLAAILKTEDYAEKLFIAGRPPAQELAWRVEALKEINENLIRGSRVEEVSTFGYRRTLTELAKILFRDDSLLWKYDVTFAALGSKLQGIGSWVFSRIVPSITFTTSVPARYYKKAMSQGIGTSWVFEFTRPRDI